MELSQAAIEAGHDDCSTSTVPQRSGGCMLRTRALSRIRMDRLRSNISHRGLLNLTRRAGLAPPDLLTVPTSQFWMQIAQSAGEPVRKGPSLLLISGARAVPVQATRASKYSLEPPHSTISGLAPN